MKTALSKLVLILCLEGFILLIGCSFARNLCKSDSLYEIGKTQMVEQKYEAAIHSFEKSIEFNEQNSNAYTGLGWAHFSLMNYDNAKLNWEKAINISPNSEALIGYGYLFFKNNDLEEAGHAFQHALKINPENSSAHLAIGRVYYKQRFLDKAIIELKEAININPKERMAYWILSEIYEKQDLNELSIKYKELALEPYYNQTDKN